MAFKMKGFPFSGKSPMKQGATNPSKDIDILEEETTESTDDRSYYNELVEKEKDGTITKLEQSALDRLRAEEE